jgi:hypothetical protein
MHARTGDPGFAELAHGLPFAERVVECAELGVGAGGELELCLHEVGALA